MKTLDHSTIAIWGDAMLAAVAGDRSELVALLRHKNEVTPDVAEFLAWLLDKRKGGRPALPAKFKILKKMHHPLFDAVFDFKQRRAHWRHAYPGYRFPYEKTLNKVAARNNVDPSKLSIELRRKTKG